MRKKLDRRKKYTRMVLKNSLITLLKEKELSAITVKEICAYADINRSTFYTHYQDQYDLLSQIEEEIIEEMTKTLKRHHFAKEKESIQMTEKLLEYIKDQKDICQTLLLSNNGKNIEKRIMDIAKDFLISNTIPTKTVEATYLSTFIVSGAIHEIKDWLTHDTLETPKQIAEMINYFSHYGLGYLKK